MKKNHVYSLLLLLICWVALPISGMASVPTKPMEAYYVNDYADVISAEDEAEILALGAAVYEACGADVVAVTVNFLDGLDIEEYGYQLFNKWALGQENDSNGVLLIVSVGDREIATLVGEDLENKLPSSVTGAYTDEYAIPYLADNDFSTGMLENYRALCQKVASIYGVTLNAAGQQYDAYDGDYGYYEGEGNANSWYGGISLVEIIIGIVVLVVIFSIVSSLFRSGGNAPGCLFGWMLGRGTHSHWGHRPYGHRQPPPRGGRGPGPAAGPGRGPSTGARPNSGGGRSTGSFGGGGFGGGSRPGGGFSGGSRPGGGPRTGGGGHTRGGGSSRKF